MFYSINVSTIAHPSNAQLSLGVASCGCRTAPANLAYSAGSAMSNLTNTIHEETK